jgi:tRNA threonylcarbamoyladenosine modification (KEOPS) complex Cgi121 subunit
VIDLNFEILGARGKFENIDIIISSLKELGDRHGIMIQIFDAKLIFGKSHLRSAVLHAKRAEENRTILANSLTVEILLYSSGERQIGQAIEKMGVKPDSSEFGLVLYGIPEFKTVDEAEKFCEKILIDLGLERDDSVLNGDRFVLERFGLTQEELDSVDESHWGNLILERVAMVDIIK